jgi:tetratricopeptide (TPR) repeat protein
VSEQASQHRMEPWMIPLGLLVIAFQGLRTIGHADFWIHLAAGRQVAAEGIQRVDSLSLVSAGEPWVHTSWLYDRLLFALWQIGGAPLITIIHVLAIVGAYWMVARVARSVASPIAIGVALLISAWLIAPAFVVSPALFALLFIAAFILVLHHWNTDWKPFALLIPLQILWTNMHASFLWGPILVGLFAIQSYFQDGDVDRRSRHATRLVGLALGLIAISVINPYGFALWGAAFSTLSAPITIDWISVLAAQFPSSPLRHILVATLIIGALGLLTCRERLPIAITGMAVISAFLAVQTPALFLGLFAILSLPFLTISLQSIGTFVAQRLLGSPEGRHATGMTVLVSLSILVAAVSLFGLISNRYYTHTGSLSTFGVGTATAAMPVGAAEIIGEENFPTNLLHLTMDGGYLAWALPGRAPYIDNRSYVHGRAAYQQLLQAMAGDEDAWTALTSEFQPDAILVNNLWPYAMETTRFLIAQGDWEPVYFDGTSSLYLRRDPALLTLLTRRDEWIAQGLTRLENERQAYARQLGQWRRPAIAAPLYGGGLVFRERRRFQEAEACFALLQAGAPRFLAAQLWQGLVQIRLEQYAAAVNTLTHVVDRIDPESSFMPIAHLNIGIGQLNLDEPIAAIRHLRQATERNPDNALAWLWLSRAYTRNQQITDATQAISRARQLDAELTDRFLAAN